MMADLKVHLLEKPSPEAEEALRERLDEGICVTIGESLPEPAEFEVLVAGRPAREQLYASSHLKMLVIPWAGVAEKTRQLAKETPGLAVHNLHYNAAMTAEMALALMLAAAKFLVPADQALRRKDWSPRYESNRMLRLEGKTALVLGYGQIGQRVGKVCAALGMRVLGVRRHSPAAGAGSRDRAGVEVYGAQALHTLLPLAQVLVVCLPATAETDGLIGSEELELMPAGGILVNVGRGAIVDQAALFEALRSGYLAGAGLDVWYNYPTSPESRQDTPPADFPFHELEHVVMSPHRGGSSQEAEVLRMEHLAALLNALARGEEVQNRVDLEAGY
jgi:phosphoglycerate dehydrogenase-like enzyme